MQDNRKIETDFQERGQIPSQRADLPVFLNNIGGMTPLIWIVFILFGGRIKLSKKKKTKIQKNKKIK